MFDLMPFVVVKGDLIGKTIRITQKELRDPPPNVVVHHELDVNGDRLMTFELRETEG
jgi:hypothetical protein